MTTHAEHVTLYLNKHATPVAHRTFVERLRHNDHANLYIVRSFDAAHRACWFLMRANALQMLKLERTSPEHVLDLTCYGEVVACGWGHTPNEDMLH